ncbi:MAG TPA: thioredoxin family protein [Vicinamibacterales bacterium]|nr:thioredoxin family protein [Vicinamibacterales bacterium]
MPLLDDKVRKQVQDALAKVEHPVKMVMFTQGEGGALECEYCSETRELVEEVSQQSEKLSLEVLDFQGDEARAREYGVDKIPAVVVLANGDGQPRHHGIRLYGIPAGYEFSALIEDLRMVGTADAKVSEATRQALAGLQTPVHLQVFVTPT